MKRSEAYHILGKMWEDAAPEQAEAISMAQSDIEFVDLMPKDMVAVVRCKDCWSAMEMEGFMGGVLYCKFWGHDIDEACFCYYGQRKGGD